MLALLTAVLTVFATALAVRIEQTPFLMPGVSPQKQDDYFCYSMKLNQNVIQNLVGFMPNITHVTHHILLFGCEEPGSQERVWNCGSEMTMDPSEKVETSPVCQNGEKILYAWAHSAPSLQLPEGVGFEVGGGTPIQYLVLQVHYNDHVIENLDKKDNSGLTLLHTVDELPRQAGVILMAGNGRLPPKRTEVVDIACPITEYVEMHPFAYRTHAHKLGQVISGYVIQDGKWNLIGKRDPNTPQMFYPVVDDSLVITTGDILAARCTYKNDNDYPVDMGSTMKDEMCNFYLMYWTEKPNPALEQDSCASLGPPLVYWETFGLKDIPADASKL